MAVAVIDTNIMIQALPGNPITKKWLARVEDRITLPCFVVMELIKGCDTRDELTRLDSFLTPYTIYWPNQEDCRRAVSIMKDNYRHGYKMGVVDALIAACAIALHAKLYTLDHDFRPVPGLKKLTPYQLSLAVSVST